MHFRPIVRIAFMELAIFDGRETDRTKD